MINLVTVIGRIHGDVDHRESNLLKIYKSLRDHAYFKSILRSFFCYTLYNMGKKSKNLKISVFVVLMVLMWVRRLY